MKLRAGMANKFIIPTTNYDKMILPISFSFRENPLE
jgi:hypothetical protein